MEKRIKLNDGTFSIVDNDIYEKIKDSKWYHNKCGYVARDLYKEKKRLLLHRFVLGLKKGDGKIVDHINGNKLDNRRKNLRICSHLNNLRNQKVRKDNKLGYKGIKLFKQKRITKDGTIKIYNHYQIVIVKNGKQIFCTSRNTLEKAILLYNKKIKEINGTFCRLNKLNN